MNQITNPAYHGSQIDLRGVAMCAGLLGLVSIATTDRTPCEGVVKLAE